MLKRINILRHTSFWSPCSALKHPNGGIEKRVFSAKLVPPSVLYPFWDPCFAVRCWQQCAVPISDYLDNFQNIFQLSMY